MGGGDLNLKKSWHPQTLRNVEKVWKAEQKAEAEAKKIEQLRRELEEERAREDMQRHAIDQGVLRKKSEKLDWMYSAPGQLNREEYLLGKAIDKAVDPLAQDKQVEDNTPTATLAGDSGVTSANDLAAKVRDDPLFMIKKKEEDKRKELASNPVKMKQFRQLLQENLAKSKKKKDKKKKKEKKEKKRRKEKHRNDSESSSDEEPRSRSRRVAENGSFEKSPNRVSYNRKFDQHERREAQNHERRSRRERSSSPAPVKRHISHSSSPVGVHRDHRSQDRWRGRDEKQGRRHRRSPLATVRRRSRSRSPAHRDRGQSRSPHRDRGQSKSPHRDRSRSRSPYHRRRRSRSRSPRKQTSQEMPPVSRDKRQRNSNVTRKMDQAELEKRRAEMMENAKVRDEQQKINIRRHREEKKRDEEAESRLNGDSAKFLNAMKVQSYSSKATASVEDRIKRNINSIQRTPAALESFLK